MAANILWIEGKWADTPSFIPGLRKKGYSVESVLNGKAAIAHMAQAATDLVVINAASLRTNGKRICQSIHNQMEALPILLIVGPEHAALKDACADEILVLPFTVRKLINRIVPFLPTEAGSVFEVGRIRLDLARRRVQCAGREARLTPRIIRLLKLLMQHPGEVIERNQVFREVWSTEYTADTRTLDVHISWLRQAIEANPREPIFLKTIRGVGYRLDP